MSALRVVVLTVGDFKAQHLWTLRAVAAAPCQLLVVRGRKATPLSRRKRLRRLVRDYGVVHVASRLVAARTIGRHENKRSARILDALFDGPGLRRWWETQGIEPIAVPHLNHPESVDQIRELQPDVLVRLSGGLLYKRIFSLPKLACLNIHHGQAPAIRGMWSIPWGLIENRPEWIGATIHEIDAGIDTGAVLWRGGPQIAPGDTGDTLFFRSHLMATQAISQLIETYAGGATPAAVPLQPQPSAYRTAPGLGPWLSYLWQRRGRTAACTWTRAT